MSKSLAITLLASFFYISPCFQTLAQFKDSDKGTDAKEKAASKEKWGSAGDITGKLIQIDTNQRILTIQVDVPYLNGRNVAQQKVDLRFRASADVAVRLARPPDKFDDKGNPQKYTQKELKDMRGPGNVPGFAGDFDSLGNGQIVQLFLKTRKDLGRLTTSEPIGKKDSPDPKRFVSMIYVLQQPAK